MMYHERMVAVIKCDGKIMREAGGKVYLPFGSEFSVLLKNKEARKAVVSVEIDGQDVLGGKQLIVNPNSSTELEGFLDGLVAKNRFKFIQKTEQISDYRGDRVDDGMVRVAFRYEKPVQSVPIVHYDHQYWPSHYHPWDVYGTSEPRLGNICKGAGGNNSSVINDMKLCSSVFTCSTSIPISEPLLDEGITVKGAPISQNFSVGTTRELEEQEHVIILTLKGTTAKGAVKEPVTVATKPRCEVCGRPFVFGAKYCSGCGNCLE